MKSLLLVIIALSTATFCLRKQLKQAKYEAYLIVHGLKSALTSPHDTWVALNQMNDLPQLDIYRNANKEVPNPEVIFYGDSITRRWNDGYLESHHYLGRGIDGQTSNQMLLRFHQDVIQLKPKMVVILGGVNDIVGLKGVVPIEATEDNIRSMVELAETHHIEPILCTVLPIFHYPGPDRSAKVNEYNNWIKRYTAEEGLRYIDYYAAMQKDLTVDGLHPSIDGYQVMEAAVEKVMPSGSISLSSLQ